MFYDSKTKKFYNSEYDLCFGNEIKKPQVNTKNEFDNLVVVEEMATKQKKHNNDNLNFDIFE